MNKISKQSVEDDLRPYFSDATIRRGWAYYKQQHVIDLVPYPQKNDPESEHFMASVLGGRSVPYEVDVSIKSKGRGGIDSIVGHCSCPVEYNCKHAVAALFLAEEKYQSLSNPVYAKEGEGVAEEALSRWLQEAQTMTSQPPQKALTEVGGRKPSVFHLIYLLHYSKERKPTLQVKLAVCRVLSNGSYGKPKDYKYTVTHEAYFQEDDESIVTDLLYFNREFQAHARAYPGQSLTLQGRHSGQCLERMVKTGRCFFEDVSPNPLTWGEKRELQLNWLMDETGSQTLCFSEEHSHEKLHVFLMDRLSYLNVETMQCGDMHTEIKPSVLEHLLNMPPVPYTLVEKTTDYLRKVLPDSVQAFPQPLDVIEHKEEIIPTPVMRLNIEPVVIQESNVYFVPVEEHPVMRIYFDYAGQSVPFSLSNKETKISYLSDHSVHTVQRNLPEEKRALEHLSHYFELQIKESLASRGNGNDAEADVLVLSSIRSDEDFFEVMLYSLPQLEASGWRIFRDHDTYFEVIQEENIEWYSELDDRSEYDYFEFKLSVMIHGQPVNILPTIAQLLTHITPEELEQVPDDKTIPLILPTNQILSVPYGRIKPMLSILVELFDSQSNEKDQLRLSRQKAALLVELKHALGADRLRWFGGEKLRQLGEKLASFTHIESVDIPDTFQATLRPYQQEGVNWLQFLREYEMGGILADDMGLGKTVQTLAHLCIEKKAGRLTSPVLIIAPTSLMANWRQEAMRFAPELRCLVHHGVNRKEKESELSQYDIVLTTYPLLVRDKDILLPLKFYYIILDEAQFIKNHKAKSTLIVQQLNATYRLCLTGTPMENHLGEMWSLFNFLMPGFLGDQRQFKRLFRTPIEKFNDQARRKGLGLRVKPFLLRRRKQDVLLDLPEKTEIIQTVELQTSERDLYEGIRLSMEEKVRDAINKKGLARSHIVILDALLKLRQTCCHPQLLKLESAKKAVQHSSKLAWLKESLPRMVEEGRKILIFSQFTSMLSLIEQMLEEVSIDYTKLTGMTKNRAQAVDSFQAGDVPVFLISLKAGGTGLNLTEADTVIHYDPWWNPAAEDQATDRAHRIGQKKAVFVYKLIAEGTVEETIQVMQKKKRDVAKSIFSSQGEASMSLTQADLGALFKPVGELTSDVV